MGILSRYGETETRHRRAIGNGERLLSFLGPEVRGERESTRGCVMLGKVTDEHP